MSGIPPEAFNRMKTDSTDVLIEVLNESRKEMSRYSALTKGIANLAAEGLSKYGDRETEADAKETVARIRRAQAATEKILASRGHTLETLNGLARALGNGSGLELTEAGLVRSEGDYSTLAASVQAAAKRAYAAGTDADAKTRNLLRDDMKKALEKAETAAKGDADVFVAGTQAAGGADAYSWQAQEHLYRCPITMGLMEDPQRNAICGHRYSKSGFLGLLSKNRNATCPLAGCSASLAQVVPDDDFAADFEAFKQKKAKGIGGSRRANVVVDD
jgi:hypothetical protein